jgi:hypothetical protein
MILAVVPLLLSESVLQYRHHRHRQTPQLRRAAHPASVQCSTLGHHGSAVLKQRLRSQRRESPDESNLRE